MPTASFARQRRRHDRFARQAAPQRIYDVVVALPPIARYSVYESSAVLRFDLTTLIENNLPADRDVWRRSTQAIYREWFVHFRYPGHRRRHLRRLLPRPSSLTGWSAGPIGDRFDMVSRSASELLRARGPVASLTKGHIPWSFELRMYRVERSTTFIRRGRSAHHRALAGQRRSMSLKLWPRRRQPPHRQWTGGDRVGSSQRVDSELKHARIRALSAVPSTVRTRPPTSSIADS